jgi:ATP-dependent Clp protease ATP-binding subunit ClpA
MFSKELELSISQAYQEARESRHEFLTVEHMLLALLDNASALSVISACEADVKALEKEIRKVLEDTVPLLTDEDSRDTQPTIGFQRVLQRALYHVQSAGKEDSRHSKG